MALMLSSLTRCRRRISAMMSIDNTPRFSGQKTGWLHTPGWKLLDAVYPGNLESFPRCFTFCTDISVQAGWRDRDDLLARYNAFERRFYERDCLQALYKVQTPRWQDPCNVILLDEMNRSRPEQYVAEFLSALEKMTRMKG